MGSSKLRRDAVENREKLIEAGREVFARHGLSATLNDVAKHAGVGVGTAYRRFANKSELIEAIGERQTDNQERILTEALALDDAWEAIVFYLEETLALSTRDRGMAQIFSGRWIDSQRHDHHRDRLAPLINEIAARGRSQGVLRNDVVGTDLIFVQVGLLAIAQTVEDGGADLNYYRRHLWLALNGLRAPSRGPLPMPALSTQETHDVLSRRSDI